MHAMEGLIPNWEKNKWLSFAGSIGFPNINTSATHTCRECHM